MTKLKKIVQRYMHLIIYGAFLLIQTYNLVPLIRCGDDYYYSNFVKSGANYFFSETAFHYTHTNGRFFVHLLDTVLLAFPLWVWKIFELIVIAAIVWFAAKIAAGKDKKSFQISLIVCSVLFSLLDITVLRQSVYWATGAVNYVFPVAFTLIFYYVYSQLDDKGRGAWYLPLLSFLAAFTVEQSSAAVIAINLFFILRLVVIKKKRILPSYIVSLILSIAAFVSVAFAPGNSVRLSIYSDFSKLSAIEKIKNNAFVFVFNAHGMTTFLTVLFLLVSCIAFLQIRKVASKPNCKRLHCAFFSVLAFSSAAAAVIFILQSELFPQKLGWVKLVAVTLGALIPVMIFFGVRFRGKDSDSFIFAVISATVFCVMIFVPVSGPRNSFLSIIFMFIPITKLFLEVKDTLIARFALPIAVCMLTAVECITISPVYVFIFVCAVAAAEYFIKMFYPGFIRLLSILCILLSFSYLFSIGGGYRENSEVNDFNERATEEYTNGGCNGTLTLSYPKNEAFSYCLPYTDPYQMMRYKQLYGIPNQCEIIYKAPDELGIK